MTIITGEYIKEYGLTPNGQMYEKHSVGSTGILRVTNCTERFLNWLIQPAIDQELDENVRLKRIKTFSSWWKLRTDNCHRGSFNTELYLKIIKAKKENGTLFR